MIKKIFEAKGKIDEMAAYFASVGNPLNTTELETHLYMTPLKKHIIIKRIVM
jgi:hypothetical protein